MHLWTFGRVAQVVLNTTRVYFYSDPGQCEAFLTDIPNGWRSLGYNDNVHVYPAEHETVLSGTHQFRRPIIDIVINETGADGTGTAHLVWLYTVLGKYDCRQI